MPPNNRVGMMPKSDWRSPDAYMFLKGADVAGFAWEYLRRNPAFERDRLNLARAVRAQRATPLELAALGCDFVAVPQNESARKSVAWTPQALPTVVCLTSLPPELLDEARSQSFPPSRGSSMRKRSQTR